MPTTIEFLPAELLGLIFEECFQIFQLEEAAEPSLSDPPWYFISKGITPRLQPTSHIDVFERFRRLTRFPYALAAVCEYWREALSTQPRFWQQAIFYLDLPPRSKVLGDTRRLLQWSRNLPIDVLIISMKPDDHLHSTPDPTQMNIIMNILSPHLFRCRSIYLQSHLGSSLPLIGDRPREAPWKISSLFISYQNNSVAIPHSQYRQFGIWVDTSAFLPSLRSLVIDGSNLENTYPLWLSLQVNLEQLVISGPYKTISFDRLLYGIHNLPKLCRLKLQNIEFKIDGTPLPNMFFNSTVRDLHLEAVSPLLVRELFRLCDFDELESVCFTHCAVEDFPSCDMLVLDDVEVNPEIPLNVMLADWIGSYLWIGRCRGFNDDVFDMLRRFDIYDREFKCPWMEKLYLFDLPSFSLKKLKKMIKRRNQSIQYNDPDWIDNTAFGPPISTLSIQNCDVAELTPEDIEWFNSYLVEFTYVK